MFLFPSRSFPEMASEPTVAVLGKAPGAARNKSTLFATVVDYWTLTKPEVNFLILVTTFASFQLAPKAGAVRTVTLIQTLVGTLLVASGAAALNQFLERSFDARMRRTARRPLAAGRLSPLNVLVFGISLSLSGALCLAAINLLTVLLAALTLLSYLFLYTPLKRKTPLSTLIGAFPGAVPPLIGWAAARGRLDAEAWALYLIVFLWQFPHFMAIAWMYREDYSRAGYQVLPARRLRDGFVAWQSFVPSLALVPAALIPSITAESGIVYWIGAAVLSLAFLYSSGRFAFHKSNVTARQLLVSSILYLPMLLTLVVLDKK
jgi:heme o synthase